MGLSSILVEFEKGLRELIAKNYGGFDFSAPQYSITRLGKDQYEITLSLSGLGIQHFFVSVIGDEFTLRGKMAAIGEKSSFPVSLVADMINSVIQKWIKDGLDSVATDANNSIVVADPKTAALKLAMWNTPGDPKHLTAVG